jgi:HD-GYP domain-containing protein (c-di-GMP phosphodiesterase class II)
MIVGRTFFNNSLSALLNKGVPLSQAHIRSIHRLNISGIYIEDEISQGIDLDPIIDEKTKLKFAKEVKKMLLGVEKRIPTNDSSMQDIIKKLIEQVSTRTSCIINMLDLKDYDNYTFQHSINVCILSIIIGVKKNLAYRDLYNLAIAAVYHDVGKMKVDPEIINKKGTLTDEEFVAVKKHPELGIEYLKGFDFLNRDIELGVAQHHERYDGSGYPLGLKNRGICLFARIIALADVFDAITSERSYKKALLPSEAIEYIMGNANQHFDFEVVHIFLNNVAVYPKGITVLLSNGMKGIVSETFEGFTTRPTVKVIPDESDIPSYYINLRENHDITIVDIIH